MQSITIAASLVFVCLALMAVAYEPNEIERDAIECIRTRYDDIPGDRAGKLQIGCKGARQSPYVDLWLASGATAEGWNRLPKFRRPGKCSTTSGSEPLLVNGVVLCAVKLLRAHCDKETTASEKDKNIAELVEIVKPVQESCTPLPVLNRVETAALECIHRMASSVQGEATALEIDCTSGKFAALKGYLARSPNVRATLQEGGKLCKSSIMTGLSFGKKAIDCAKRMLERICGYEGPGAATGLDYASVLIAAARPRQSEICEDA